MLLENKVAVIHGGGGAIGGAIAREFAREGAKVYLAGRSPAKLERVARDIGDSGGFARYAEVDALLEASVDRHVDEVAAREGGIDIAVNAVGFMHVQGTPFGALSLNDYSHPLTAYSRTNFITAKAVSKHMVRRGSGVILTLSTPGSRLSGTGFMGIGVAGAAVEALSRILAGELGPHGIRVICLRPDAIPEAMATSHTGQVFANMAASMDTTPDELLLNRARNATLLRRLPTLAEVGSFAALVASERASAMTGAIANLSCGSLVD